MMHPGLIHHKIKAIIILNLNIVDLKYSMIQSDKNIQLEIKTFQIHTSYYSCIYKKLFSKSIPIYSFLKNINIEA